MKTPVDNSHDASAQLRHSTESLRALLGLGKKRRGAPLLWLLTGVCALILLAYGGMSVWASLKFFVADTSLRMLPQGGPTVLIQREDPSDWVDGDNLYVDPSGDVAQIIAYEDRHTTDRDRAALERSVEGIVCYLLPSQRILRLVAVGAMLVMVFAWVGTAPDSDKDGIIAPTDTKEINH